MELQMFKKLDYGKVRPLHDLVLLKLDEPMKRAPNGLFLPADPKKDEYFRKGTVVRLGMGKYTNDGSVVEIKLAVGDRVLLPHSCGGMLDRTLTKDEEPAMLLVKESDIYAVLEKGAEDGMEAEKRDEAKTNPVRSNIIRP